MLFLNAAKDACAIVFPCYVALVVMAHVFRWRRYKPLRLLGLMAGGVVGVGLSVQWGLAAVAQSLLIGLMIGIVTYSFAMLERKFPLQHAS